MRIIRMLPIALPVLLSAFSIEAQDRLTGTWQPWGRGGGAATGTSFTPSGGDYEGGAWQCVPGGVNPNAPYTITATFNRLSQSGGTVYVRLRWYSDTTCQTFLDRESGSEFQDWGPNPAPQITLNPVVSAPSTARGAAFIVSVLGRPGTGECSYAFSGLSMTGSPFLLTTIAAIGSTTLCSPEQVHLRASASGGTGVYTAYQWYRNGLSLDQSATQDFYVSDSGTYAAAAIDSSGYTGVLSNVVSALIVPTPDPPGATNNGPLCSGATLQLTAVPSIPGAAYAWVGPNGFTSTSQNPLIPHATATASGNYFVTVSVNGCTSPAATTSVTVTPVPAAPTGASNSPICSGATLSLSASTIPGAAYSWSGPNGFTASIQNPVIPNATAAASGTYSVTATANGCTSAAGNTAVTVNATPMPPTASSNSPVLVGETIRLAASNVAGASYSWSGPSGFSSTDQNPIIPNATVAASGTYSVVAALNGCTSVADSTTVTVHEAPLAPTADFSYSPASPIAGQPVLFTDTSTGSPTSWFWSFGDGSTSTASGPTHTYPSAGTYDVSLTATNAQGTSLRTRTIVVSPVVPAPVIDHFTANPTTVAPGQATTLSWLTSGADAAWIDQNVGDVPVSGTITIHPTTSTSYKLTASGPGGIASATIRISIVPPPYEATWLLPSSARVRGHNAFWITDLVLLNTGTQTARVSLRFLGHAGNGSAGQEEVFDVQARRTLVFPDVLSTVFGRDSDWGPILIRSSVATLAVQGQTRTASPTGGWYGQSVPALTGAEFLGSSPKGLAGLQQNSQARTNIVLANAKENEASVTLRILLADGTTATTRTVTIGPLGFTQLNLADDLGVTNFADGSALVSCLMADCQVAVYASIIDAATADPKTVLAR